MFELKESRNEHHVYSYCTKKHPFINFFEKLYNVPQNKLNKIFMKSNDFKNSTILNDIDTDLHNIFYNNIKNDDTFKKLYCNFIKDIHQQFFPNEEALIYQSFPKKYFHYF